MKILYVLENYYPFVGGVETLFQNVCEGMATKHTVAVICSAMDSVVPPKGQNYICHNGVFIHRVNTKNRFLFPLFALYKSVQMAKISDVIHTSTYTGAFPAWVASKIWHKPCVITVHEVLGDRWKKFGFKHAWLLELLEKIILKLDFDKYISVSQSTQRQLGRMGIQSEVIYNGIDYEHWNPDKYEPIRLHDGFTYLYFGRPGITKGLHLLLNVASQVSKVFSKSKLVMILSAEPIDQRQEILRLIKALGLEEHIIVMKSVPYGMLPRYIKGADCVVVPSLSEGFGFSCAEACAMGVPVVVTDVDSLPEVVSGKYKVARCSVKSLTEAITDIPDGIYNVTQLKKFTWDRNIQEHESLYRSLV